MLLIGVGGFVRREGEERARSKLKLKFEVTYVTLISSEESVDFIKFQIHPKGKHGDPIIAFSDGLCM